MAGMSWSHCTTFSGCAESDIIGLAVHKDMCWLAVANGVLNSVCVYLLPPLTLHKRPENAVTFLCRINDVFRGYCEYPGIKDGNMLAFAGDTLLVASAANKCVRAIDVPSAAVNEAKCIRLPDDSALRVRPSGVASVQNSAGVCTAAISSWQLTYKGWHGVFIYENQNESPASPWTLLRQIGTQVHRRPPPAQTVSCPSSVRLSLDGRRVFIVESRQQDHVSVYRIDTGDFERYVENKNATTRGWGHKFIRDVVSCVDGCVISCGGLLWYPNDGASPATFIDGTDLQPTYLCHVPGIGVIAAVSAFRFGARRSPCILHLFVTPDYAAIDRTTSQPRLAWWCAIVRGWATTRPVATETMLSAE